MKRLILILAFSGIPFSLFAQQWQWLYPYPTTNTVIDFYFTDKDNGFIIAENGEILRTNDGGSTWESKILTNVALLDIFFLSITKGWILAMENIDWNTNQIILKTEDGGANWERHDLGSAWGYACNSIFFISETKGWIAGTDGTIKMTNDGGVTWSDKSIISADPPNIFFIYFADDQNGTFIGQRNGIIIGETKNGGSSWSLKTAGVGNSFYGGCFAGSNTFYAVGERGLILATNNHGSNWSFPSNIPQKTLNSISFCDQMTGWVVGGDSTVMKTVDGGQTWEAKSLGLSSEFISVKFKDSTTGWILGTQDEYDPNDPSSQSFLFTDNGGEKWENKFISFDEITDFNDVCFVDSLNGWLISNEKIYHTNTGGKIWKIQYVASDDGWVNEYLSSIFFVDSLNGFCVGSKDNNGFILKTANGGANWVAQSYAFGPLYDIHFISALTGWFVGSGGIILRTLNGGASFEYLTSGVGEGIVDVYFLDDDHGWALTEYQTVLKTNDGGISWTPYEVATSMVDFGQCIFFADTLTGFVGTTFGLYKSTDGGKNWSWVHLTSYDNITDIYFANAQEGWVLAGFSHEYLGSGGVVYYTQDGGATWSEVFYSGQYFDSFSFVPEGYAWIVGNNSTIAKYAHGKHLTEVDSKKSEIGPVSYKLYQCYPNPFNPSTTITYDLPEKSFVELKVYDALGQEVKTLVNGYKDKGRHQVSLNLQNYASGTYFYRIKANNFSEGKKLLLVK